tara:strand:+ start:258 stop:635 length:378 start_codon:yes stop_codon:yes gene_type:complete
MAEALAKKYLNNFIIESAGTNPEPINSLAIVVMKEINIDLSNQNSKSISDKDINSFDLAITLCGDAKDKCINLNHLVKQFIHWNINDPAKANGTNKMKLNVYRDVRDQIKNKIITFRKKHRKIII